MVHKRTATFVAALAAVCLLSGSALAVQGKCLASKNKCMSKKAGSLLKCQQKAETPGKPTDPNFGGCEDKARAKFEGVAPSPSCFKKAENKSSPADCVTVNNTTLGEQAVEDCVDKLVTAIDPPPLNQTKCGAGKKKCVAKKLKSILKCHQNAETPGKPPDPNFNDCVNKARDKYDGGSDQSKGCFVQLESKMPNDCMQPTGNQQHLEDLVDSCVGAFLALLETPTTTTTTTSTTTTTTTTTSTTTTTTTTTSTTSTTTTSTSTTTTTTLGFLLDFTTGASGGTCGSAMDATNTVIKTLHCGGLNIGGGNSTVQEGPTPDGATNRFTLGCSGSSCVVGATTTAPAVNSAQPDCTGVGCNFGTPLEIPNPSLPILTTCVLDTYSFAASGTLDLGTGTSSTSAVLSSDTYLTGNLTQPCPRCYSGGVPVSGSPGSPATGTCDRGPRTGMACTSTNSVGLTRDCLTGGSSGLSNCPNGTGSSPCTCIAGSPGMDACTDGSHVGPIAVNLSPLTTGTTVSTNATGKFCPGQGGTPGTPGCFGTSGPPTNKLCTTITENGTPAGPLTVGTPASVTLAYVFCIPPTSNGTVNFAADLPGPGAVSLPGNYLVH
jgi:hypothetical protein